MVRRLDDTAPQLQIVQSVREMQSSLQTLPDAIAQTVVPLQASTESMAQRLDEALAAQRRALDALTAEMASSAAAAMQQQAQALAKPLQQMQAQAQALAQSVRATEATLRRIESLPDRISAAAGEMRSAAAELRSAAQDARPRWWPMLAAAVGAGVLAALLVLTGRGVFERLLPPGDVQQRAQAWAALMQRATPAERESIRQIVNRPAN